MEVTMPSNVAPLGLLPSYISQLRDSPGAWVFVLFCSRLHITHMSGR